MAESSNKSKGVFAGYLILTFYYLGVLAMLYALTYPPFKEVHQNFGEHAQVLERYLIWALYVPGILMALSALTLIFFRPVCLPAWAVVSSALLSLVSVATMFLNMIPFHHQWTTAGFDSLLFEQSKNITFAFQIVPSILQALVAICFLYVYLSGIERRTRMLFTALFVLCFFPMGTIIVECHLNYALWATVAGNEWLAYRQWLAMPSFLTIFLIPFYFPMILLAVLVWKKRRGLSRALVAIALITLFYVFVISAAYFVPDIQFELDKYHSQKLLAELIRNEIRMRTPAEVIYWTAVALMLWKFKPDSSLPKQVA